jgi:hypothetical protein
MALGCLILLIVIGGLGLGGYWIYDSTLGSGTLFAEDTGSYISPADLHEYGPNFDETINTDDTEFISSEGETFRVFGQLFIKDKTTATFYQPGRIDSDFGVTVDFSNLSIEERHKITDEYDLQGVIVVGTLTYPGEVKYGGYVWTRTLEATSIEIICSTSQSQKRPVRQ